MQCSRPRHPSVALRGGAWALVGRNVRVEGLTSHRHDVLSLGEKNDMFERHFFIKQPEAREVRPAPFSRGTLASGLAQDGG